MLPGPGGSWWPFCCPPGQALSRRLGPFVTPTLAPRCGSPRAWSGLEAAVEPATCWKPERWGFSACPQTLQVTKTKAKSLPVGNAISHTWPQHGHSQQQPTGPLAQTLTRGRDGCVWVCQSSGCGRAPLGGTRHLYLGAPAQMREWGQEQRSHCLPVSRRAGVGHLPPSPALTRLLLGFPAPPQKGEAEAEARLENWGGDSGIQTSQQRMQDESGRECRVNSWARTL